MINQSYKFGQKTRVMLLRFVMVTFSLAFSGIGGAYGQAAAPTLKPLDHILSELKAQQDLTKASYLFKRCSGYSLAVSALLLRSGGDGLKERASQWRKGAIDMVEYAVDTEMAVEKSRTPNSKKSKDEWAQETVVIAQQFMHIYIERMNANYLRSGNYMIDDAWMKSEHEICQEPSKKVMESLR